MFWAVNCCFQRSAIESSSYVNLSTLIGYLIKWAKKLLVSGKLMFYVTVDNKLIAETKVMYLEFPDMLILH